MNDRATTERQRRILDTIRQFTEERGYPPSVREIGERVGLSSSSTVQSHLKTLERRGLIRRDPTKPRALVSSESVPRSVPDAEQLAGSIANTYGCEATVEAEALAS